MCKRSLNGFDVLW